MLDQLDKDVNTFSMRMKEWYSYHFPELARIVTDNAHYAQVVLLVKRRGSSNDDLYAFFYLLLFSAFLSHNWFRLGKLEEILMDSAKAQQVIDSSKQSMGMASCHSYYHPVVKNHYFVGMDISEIDLLNINAFAKRVISLSNVETMFLTCSLFLLFNFSIEKSCTNIYLGKWAQLHPTLLLLWATRCGTIYIYIYIKCYIEGRSKVDFSCREPNYPCEVPCIHSTNFRSGKGTV